MKEQVNRLQTGFIPGSTKLNQEVFAFEKIEAARSKNQPDILLDQLWVSAIVSSGKVPKLNIDYIY